MTKRCLECDNNNIYKSQTFITSDFCSFFPHVFCIHNRLYCSEYVPYVEIDEFDRESGRNMFINDETEISV